MRFFLKTPCDANTCVDCHRELGSSAESVNLQDSECLLHSSAVAHSGTCFVTLRWRVAGRRCGRVGNSWV